MRPAAIPLRSAFAFLVLSGCNAVTVDAEQRAATIATEGANASAVVRPGRPLGPDRNEYEAAYGSLQKAIAVGDRVAASRLVNYPLTVSKGAVRRTIASPEQFITEYDTIITPSVREVIVERDFDDAVNHRYDRSNDVDLFVAGALLGAVTEGVARSWGRRHSASDNDYYQGYANYYYDGCHGVGCLVDPPPPVETYDGYSGCLGDGCLMDSPGAGPGAIAMERPLVTDGIPEPGQNGFSGGRDDGPPEPGQTTLSSGPDGPPEPGQMMLSGGSDRDSSGPPEPRQDGDSDDGTDGSLESRLSDDIETLDNSTDDSTDDTPDNEAEPEQSDDSDGDDAENAEP